MPPASLRSSPLVADMVSKMQKSRTMPADMLFTPGLLGLTPPTICCVRSQSVRDLVTEISGGATPAPVRCGSELSSSELATQARPSQPHSRLMMPVHVVSRLASIAAHIHTHPWANFGPYPVCIYIALTHAPQAQLSAGGAGDSVCVRILRFFFFPYVIW